MSIPARGMVAGSRRSGWSLDVGSIRNVAVRHKVNDLLATGSSYAMIVRALDVENSDMDVRDRITIDSVRNHCSRHFPVQNGSGHLQGNPGAEGRRTGSTSSIGSRTLRSPWWPS